MLKFTIGALMLLGTIASFVISQQVLSIHGYELYGFIVGKVAIIVLAIWLMYSGGKKIIKDLKSEKRVRITFFEFIKQFFGDYKGFLTKYIKKIHTPFLVLVVWLSGISFLFDRIESGSLLPDQISSLTNWLHIWLYVILLGWLYGFITYTIGGTLFHIPVWLSGGEKDMRASRKIFIYSGLPFSIIIILSKIFYTFVYGDSYFTADVNKIWVYIWLLLAFASLIYMITLTYKGVRLIQKTKKIRSIIFFIIIPVLLYILVFAGLAIKVSDPVKMVVAQNEQATEQVYKGNYSEAEKYLKLALENMDKNASEENFVQIYLNLATVVKAKGDIDSAKGYYQKALALTDENKAEYFVIYGELDLFEDKTDSAINNFQKALNINPDNFEANNNLGLIFLLREDYEKAFPYNIKAYELNEDLASIENLALNYYFLEDFDNAYPLYIKLLKLNPDHVRAKYFLGLIYYVDGNYKDAKIYLEEAVALDPHLLTKDVQKILDEISD